MRAGRAWAPLVLAGACVPLLFWRLGSYSLVNGDEALYHGVAESMAASGDWWTLTFRGEPRLYDTFMNAPLHYWARALLVSLFGSNLWTARVLSAAFGLGSVLATFALGDALDRGRGPWSGLLAGLALLTSLQFVFLHSARTGELDTMVTFFLVVAALQFLRTIERGGRFVGHHASLAVLVTLKLPLVLVPVLAELGWFALVRPGRGALRRWLALGLVAAPVALAWHVAHLFSMGDAALDVLRTMGGQASGRVGEAIGGASSLAYYAGVIVFGTFPHALAWPWAVASVLGRARAVRRPAVGGDGARWLLAALYAGGVLLFFGVVHKRAPWYVLPAYPFLCAFQGRWLVELARRGAAGIEVWAVGAVAAAVAWVRVPLIGYDPFVLPAVHAPMPVAWRGPGGALSWLGFGVTALALGAGLRAARGRLGPRAGPALAGALCALLFVPAAIRTVAPLAHLGRQSPLAQLAREVEEAERAGRPPAGPIDVPSASLILTRYYFGDAWRVVPVASPGGPPRLRLVRRPVAGNAGNAGTAGAPAGGGAPP